MNRTRTDSTDDALIRMGGSSRLAGALARPGRLFVCAWPESFAAAATSRWLSIALDVRVRFMALAASVAIVTHIVLTGFRAPEPTATARTAWIGVLLGLITIGFGARTVAAAWTDRRVRRMKTREGETA